MKRKKIGNDFFRRMESFFEEFALEMDNLKEFQSKTDSSNQGNQRDDERVHAGFGLGHELLERNFDGLSKRWRVFRELTGVNQGVFLPRLGKLKRLGDFRFDLINRWISTDPNGMEHNILFFASDCVGIVEVKGKGGEDGETDSKENQPFQH